MVTILTPGSAQVMVGTESNLLQWSNESTGQTSFEVMFKLKDESVWNTAGKIESAEASYDLNELYEIATAHYASIDLIKLSYKVRVYYDNITDESNIYVIIFSGAPVSYINIAETNGVSRYPLFDSVNNPNVNSLKVRVNDQTLTAPLVESDSILASRIMFRVGPNNVRALMRSYVDISDDITYNNFQRYGYAEASYIVPQYEEYRYATYHTYYSYDDIGYSSYETYYSYYYYFYQYVTKTTSYASSWSYYYYYYGPLTGSGYTYYYRYYPAHTGTYYIRLSGGMTGAAQYTYYSSASGPAYSGASYTYWQRNTDRRVTGYSYKYYTTTEKRSALTYRSNGYAYSSYYYTAYADDGLSELTGYTYGYLDKSYYVTYNYKYMYT